MASVPIRKLGAMGIIKDVDPYDLPDNALSDGMNVRFDNGKVERAYIYRLVKDTLTGSTPVFSFGINGTGGAFDKVLYVNNDGRSFTVANGAETEVTPTVFTPTVDPHPFTATFAAQCVYLNRPSDVPQVLTPTAAKFVALPNWPAGYTAAAIRPFGSFLVALNITKSGTSYPNMFKWSTDIQGNTYPSSWDYTDPTLNAGENPISQLTTPIVDGGALGNAFAMYTQDEVWLVEQIGGGFIFNFRRLPFDEAGLINQNCYVEIDGKHYCFGFTDIYEHDGVEKTSIIDQRNREKLFKELSVKDAQSCFIAHNRRTHEIIFCHVSGNANAAWPATIGYCNYGAVFNYVTRTWSFVDLPNVSSACLANVNTVYTYDTVPANLTYDNIGGSYDDQLDSFARHTVFTGVGAASFGLTQSKIFVLDSADFASKVALPLDTTTVRAAWVQRTGLDFDIEGAPARGYKHPRSVIPRATVYSANVLLNVQLGGQLVAGSPVVWEASQTFDPTNDYKVDTRAGGRFLAVKFTMPTANDFALSGYDIDVVITGRR